MYSGIQKIEEVIEHIEKNITSTISCDELAAGMNLSVYEFRRIFSFVVGCPISEYIRKRRLSLAALEILGGEETDMQTLSEKYGYSTQSAFIKAFGEQHGVSPTVLLKQNRELTLFTRPKFELKISGREEISMKIAEESNFYVCGFEDTSPITDSCCCENVWNSFYEKGVDSALEKAGHSQRIYAVYNNIGENVRCTIGAKTKNEVENFSCTYVKGGKWAVFKLKTVQDDEVNRIYSKIFYEWLPSANLKRKEGVPIVENYPFDMSMDGFEWEIRIPID